MTAQKNSYPFTPDNALEGERSTRIIGDFSTEVQGEDRGSPLEPADTTDPFIPQEDGDVERSERYHEDTY